MAWQVRHVMGQKSVTPPQSGHLAWQVRHVMGQKSVMPPQSGHLAWQVRHMMGQKSVTPPQRPGGSLGVAREARDGAEVGYATPGG